jgi:Domain of unknown function (DUF4173)
MTATTISQTFQSFSLRGLRLALAGALALFVGYIAQAGVPGSVVAMAFAAVFAMQLAEQAVLGWTRACVAAAAINGIAIAAVAMAPGALNMGLAWAALAGFALMQNGAHPRRFAALITSAMGSLAATPWGVATEMSPRKIKIINLLLPVLAVAVFGALLMTANPVIERALRGVSIERMFATWMPIVTLTSFIAIMALMRMKADLGMGAVRAPWGASVFAPAPVALTLVLLNAMFAIENGLDLAYVWQGVTLPAGMNHAEYVHRGAYALIVTAVLAGALVMLALQPGSQSEGSRPVRALVYLWTAQNVLLVASSANRTLAYIDAYGMTLWRLSGLIWMGLVAAGLIFIAGRVLTQRSSTWLMNANLGAAFLVLLSCGMIDLRAIVAEWNVSRALTQLHAQQGITTLDLDLAYLEGLGPSAIPPLQRLLAFTPADGSVWTAQGSVAAAAKVDVQRLCGALHATQADWTRWTARNWAYDSCGPP